VSSFNLLLAGVGGQGVVLSSKLFLEEAMSRGSEARGAETHGMAQRGGSVVAHLRLGPCRSPLIVPGTGHMLLAMERLEGLRNLRFLRPGGAFLINSPGLDFIGSEIRAYLERERAQVLHLDASRMALDAGNPLSVNMIMAGFAAAHPTTPFRIEGLREAAGRIMRESFLKGSLEALDAGYAAGTALHESRTGS
jgi:indolepyruvate ferredoxin oxidoreductase beta subunit